MKKQRTKFRRGSIRVNYFMEDYDQETIKKFREYLREKGIKESTIDNYMSSWKTNKSNSETTKRHFHKFITSDKVERARVRQKKNNEERFAKRKPKPNLLSKLFDPTKVEVNNRGNSGSLSVVGDEIKIDDIDDSISFPKEEPLQLVPEKQERSDEEILKDRFEQIFALDMPLKYKLNFLASIIVAEGDCEDEEE